MAMPLSLYNVSSQEESLEFLRDVTRKSMTNPAVRSAAVKLTSRCDARDDLCEVEAVFNAVKEGDDAVKGLERGVRYVSDPRPMDHFTAPARLLRDCADGACAEDCDGHAALICALLGSVGFRVGLRAYGKKGQNKSYDHVYAVVALPKHGAVKQIVGLDTTVPSSEVGWEPPKGHVLTAWID